MICFNWFNPIIKTAADVKPLINSLDKKLTKNFNLNIPKATLTTPV